MFPRESGGGLSRTVAGGETLKPFAGFRAARASIRVSREAGVDDDVDGPPPVYLGIAAVPVRLRAKRNRGGGGVRAKMNVFGGTRRKRSGAISRSSACRRALGATGAEPPLNAIFFDSDEHHRDREICVDEVVVEG